MVVVSADRKEPAGRVRTIPLGILRNHYSSFLRMARVAQRSRPASSPRPEAYSMCTRDPGEPRFDYGPLFAAFSCEARKSRLPQFPTAA